MILWGGTSSTCMMYIDVELAHLAHCPPSDRANHLPWLDSTVGWIPFCASRNNSRNVPRFWGSHPPNNCCHFPARCCQNLTHHQILPSCLCTQPCHWLESLGHYHMAKHLPFLFRLPLTILVSSITEGLKLRTKSCYFKDSTVTVWVRFWPASRRVTRLTCFLGWY